MKVAPILGNSPMLSIPASAQIMPEVTRTRRLKRRWKYSGIVVRRICRRRRMTNPVAPKPSGTIIPRTGMNKKLKPRVKPSIAAYIKVTSPRPVPTKLAILSAVPDPRPPTR